MLRRQRKIKVRKAEPEAPEGPEESQEPVQRMVKRDMKHMKPSEIERAITDNREPAQSQDDNFPLNEDQQEPIDDNHFITKLINDKKDLLGSEKIELKTLQNQIQSQLKTLETKIKTHYDEIQALEYIASGEPTMTIVDIIDIINDFKNDRSYKNAEEVLNAMEKTILKSTLDSIRT